MNMLESLHDAFYCLNSDFLHVLCDHWEGLQGRQLWIQDTDNSFYILYQGKYCPVMNLARGRDVDALGALPKKTPQNLKLIRAFRGKGIYWNKEYTLNSCVFTQGQECVRPQALPLFHSGNCFVQLSAFIVLSNEACCWCSLGPRRAQLTETREISHLRRRARKTETSVRLCLTCTFEYHFSNLYIWAVESQHTVNWQKSKVHLFLSCSRTLSC